MKVKFVKSIDIHAAKLPFVARFKSYLIVNLAEGIVLFDRILNKVKTIHCEEVDLPLFKCFSQDLILFYSLNSFILIDIETEKCKKVVIPEWLQEEGFSPLYWWEDPSRIVFCSYKGDLIECDLMQGLYEKIESSELKDIYPGFFTLWAAVDDFRYLIEANPKKYEIVIKDLPHTRMIVKNILHKQEYYCSFPFRIFNFSYCQYIFAFTQQECMYLINVKNKARIVLKPSEQSIFANKSTFINEHTFVVPTHDNTLYSYSYNLNLYRLKND